MQQDVTVLEIDWSEAAGSTANIGAPYLFGWLRAAYITPGLIADGRVVVLARSEHSTDWTRYEGGVSEAEAVTLICMLSGLGIPARGPRIECVVDTSDTLYTSSVRITVEQQQQTFNVESQCNGFSGEDASGLREVFQRILRLAGHAHGNTIFADTRASTR